MIFELKTELSYAHNNVDLTASHVELIEPTGKVSHLCCDIESLIQSSIMAMSSMIDDETVAQAREAAAAAKVDEEERAGPDVESALSIMSGGGEMKKIVIAYRELFKEVALVGGDKKMTGPLLDRMSHKDLRQMMGVYTANFILG